MKYENQTLFLDGKLTKFTVPDLLHELSQYKGKKISTIDLSEVSSIDSAGVAFLDELVLNLHKFKPQLANMNEIVESAVSTFTSLSLKKPVPGRKDNFFILIGEGLLRWRDSTRDAIYLIADIFYWSFVGLFNRKGQRQGSIIQQSLIIGVDAVGIIALLSFILGLILALQSAAQLRQFGANIFVADLMAISMVTEMGPILTAIILAGRSGSSIASEIATMKVTEEIDALRMMAINPIRYIVVPKFLAITICIPLLVTMSTLVGILGGLIVAVTYLDLSAVVFFNRVFEILTMRDALIGLGKSFFFAWVIVIIGSYYGFNVKGGAEGVGKVTTQAVVASIFWVIILDALNSLIFYFKT
ncbi:MAG: MlaE family lipid ABC transporter permease subunit [Candidatus Cloacimonetes bacterium]|nr:MlaE family lipid ABC transporter permease subunit [Candidatus Cloacimonadota bacterium]MBL7149023.1 MlaE family lipid ABC transporter permease subunit [Candidatus Cloacimonadota bacterium]